MQKNLTRWMITVGVAGAVVCSASASFALIDKCQAELELRTSLFRSKVEKALTKCSDSIRKEVQKNNVKAGTGFLTKGAKVCQTELGKIFDTSVHNAGKSERDKFYAKIDSAFVVASGTPKCNGLGDLTILGHMASGGTNVAPGTATQSFIRNWLAVDAVRSAINDQNSRHSDFLNLVQNAISAPALSATISVGTAATDCDLPLTCDPKLDVGCRPDLCNFKVQCREHACTLASGSATKTRLAGGLTVNAPLAGRSTMTVCTMKGFGYQLGNSGEGYLLTGGPGRLISPPIVSGNAICVDNVRAQGYCSCASDFLGKPKNSVFCQDHIASNSVCTGPATPNACCTGVGTGTCDDCNGTATAANAIEECYCALNPSSTTNTRCGPGFPVCAAGYCGQTSTNAPCHAGSEHTGVEVTNSGSTVAGDCVALNSTQFKTLSTATGATCDGVGPSNAPEAYGPDCLPCTADDKQPPAAVATVPFTTGTSTATLKDAVNTQGACVAQPSHNCIEDVNCHTTDNPTDTCDGNQVLIPDFTVGPANSVCTANGFPFACCTGNGTGNGTAECAQTIGSPISSCSNLESSNLTGLTLVGGFPAIDSGTLGDLATTFTLTCN